MCHLTSKGPGLRDQDGSRPCKEWVCGACSLPGQQDPQRGALLAPRLPGEMPTAERGRKVKQGHGSGNKRWRRATRGEIMEVDDS